MTWVGAFMTPASVWRTAGADEDCCDRGGNRGVVRRAISGSANSEIAAMSMSKTRQRGE